MRGFVVRALLVVAAAGLAFAIASIVLRWLWP
jgi:hypothetical protein